MCAALEISRSIYYYEVKRAERSKTDPLTETVISAFEENHGNYGAKKLRRFLLLEKGIRVSRRRIRRIMKENNLFSTYTVKKFKVFQDDVNRDPVENVVDRQFDDRAKHEVVVSDLTYINVNGKWNYLCILVDLFNREIIRFAREKWALI